MGLESDRLELADLGRAKFTQISQAVVNQAAAVHHGTQHKLPKLGINPDHVSGSLSYPAARSFASTSHPLASSSTPQSASVVSPLPRIPSEVQSHRQNQLALASADSDLDPAPFHLDPPTLSLLYSLTTPPPPTALAAFAARLGAATPSASLAPNLALVEQCLVHPSFWDAADALPAPALPAPALGATARRLTHHLDGARLDNGPLATLGNALLGTLTAELVLAAFPSLPTRVAKAGLTMYVGPKALAEVARASWGVGPSRRELQVVGQEEEARLSRRERAYGHLVGGVGGARKETRGEKDGAAGAGLVRWNRRATSPTKDAVLYEEALASVARAVVGAVYTTHGFAATRTFVHQHFLARLLPPASASHPPAAQDLVPLLKFTNPSRVLSLQLQAAGRPALVHRLLKESGRLSAHPTFVAGAFAGADKVGEGFGSSIKMAEWRASEDGLRRMYLRKGEVGGEGLPSDGWAGGEFGGLSLGETEVVFGSR